MCEALVMYMMSQWWSYGDHRCSSSSGWQLERWAQVISLTFIGFLKSYTTPLNSPASLLHTAGDRSRVDSPSVVSLGVGGRYSKHGSPMPIDVFCRDDRGLFVHFLLHTVGYVL